MKSEGYDPEEIGARGRAIYEEKIRHLVIDTEKGKILVIDVESGDHEVDEAGTANQSLNSIMRYLMLERNKVSKDTIPEPPPRPEPEPRPTPRPTSPARPHPRGTGLISNY